MGVVDGGSVVVEGEVEVSFGSLELKGNAELTVDAKSDDYVAIDISGDVTFSGSNQEITVVFDRSASAMARRALLQNTTDSGDGSEEGDCTGEFENDRFVVRCPGDPSSASALAPIALLAALAAALVALFA